MAFDGKTFQTISITPNTNKLPSEACELRALLLHTTLGGGVTRVPKEMRQEPRTRVGRDVNRKQPQQQRQRMVVPHVELKVQRATEHDTNEVAREHEHYDICGENE